jgi:hypothetical protein
MPQDTVVSRPEIFADAELKLGVVESDPQEQ